MRHSRSGRSGRRTPDRTNACGRPRRVGKMVDGTHAPDATRRPFSSCDAAVTRRDHGRDVPDARVQLASRPRGRRTQTPISAASDSPLLATALARSFELVAGIALFALSGDRGGRRADSRARPRPAVGFAVELVSLGIALVVLALLLSRRSARAVDGAARGPRRRARRDHRRRPRRSACSSTAPPPRSSSWASR